MSNDNNILKSMPQEAAFVVLEQMADPVLIFEVETLEIAHLNRAAVLLAEMSTGNGKELKDFASWLGLSVDEAFSRFGHGNVSSLGAEHIDVRHLNSHFDVSVKRPPKSGFSDKIVAIFRDITNREETERLKQELVSNVSHELRSPLTAIKGAMGLVLAGTAGDIPPRAQDMIQIAQRNADRLILIINDILDLDKIADGAMVFDNADTTLKDVIDAAVESISGFRGRFDVDVTVQIDTPMAMSFVDPNRLVQVLVNLMSNAIKFSPIGSEVQVQLGRYGDFNRISITDQGEGIPEAEQELLFKRFTQIGATNRAATGGTGLGLSIVKAILEKQSGHVSFDSEVGRGTTFYVDLPRSAKESEMTQKKSVVNL